MCVTMGGIRSVYWTLGFQNVKGVFNLVRFGSIKTNSGAIAVQW